MSKAPLLALAVSLLGLSPVRAEPLPLLDTVEWTPFRTQTQALLHALARLDGAVPAETVQAVQSLLEPKMPANPRRAARTVQKLLDAHCLIGVTINPESRVKAARGPRRGELIPGRPVYVLVKVHNDGGVTHPLAVASDQAVRGKTPDADRWVEVEVLNDRPFVRRLSGAVVEYRVMKLVAHQVGKREATLVFDVGQGSQDLGFRAEVPILFTVRPR